MDLNLKFECFNSGYCVSFKLEYYPVKSDSTGNGSPIPYISVSLTIALRLLHNYFNIPLFIADIDHVENNIKKRRKQSVLST